MSSDQLELLINQLEELNVGITGILRKKATRTWKGHLGRRNLSALLLFSGNNVGKNLSRSILTILK